MKELLQTLARLLLSRKLAARELHVLVIFLVLGFPVVVDLINGFLIQMINSDYTLGVFYRGMAMVAMIPFVLLLRDFTIKLYLALLVGLWLLGNLIWMEATQDYDPIREVQLFSKVLYPWILYAYFSYVLEKYDIPLAYAMQCFVFFGTVAALSILFSYFTGYGISTYERASTFAVKSYFKAQNDIGLTILLCLVFGMYLLVRYGHWMYGVYSVLMMAGLVLLGTRAGLLGGFATIGSFTVLFVGGTANPGKRNGKRVVLVGFLLLSIVGGVFFAISTISQYRYLYNKYASLLEGTPRETTEDAAKRRLAERGNLATLFGEGTTSFRVGVLRHYPNKEKEGITEQQLSTGKAVEQDIYDLTGAFGLVLGGLILSVVVILYLRVLASFLTMWNLLDFTFLMAFSLFIVHSFLAGHALGSSTVAAPAAIIYYYAIDRAKVCWHRRSNAEFSRTGGALIVNPAKTMLV
jgi:hypothetical protein